MYKAIHFDGSKLLKSDSYLRGQDIVYRSPAYMGYDALPFGDGDTTYLFWNTKRSMVFHINKSDAVDFRSDGNFKAWSWESEEKNTAQVHCARIMVGDLQPSFDTLYLNDFEQRLIMEEGRVNLRSETPFSKWNCSAFASFGDKVMVAKIKCSSSEPVERKIALEAWGSRSDFHFYEQIVNDTSKRIGDTYSGQKDGAAYVMRKLAVTTVVTCLKVIGAEYGISTPNSHTAEITLPMANEEDFILISATVAGESDEGLIDRAVSLVDNAAKDISRIEKKNSEYWWSFWNKSFIHLQDDYLENLYNFNLYSLNCCSRGKYPVNALGGAWTWNADVRNWGHFYHWNGQQTFWGLEQSNHPDLAMNYYDFRCAMLKNAESDAQKYFGVDGAFFSDICNLNGFQALEPDTVRNLTVGPQIALDLYRHYQYSTDKDFLRDKAYPFMKACLKFYMGLLKKENGVYHIAGGRAAYESYWNLKDTITDYCMIKKLIEAVMEAEEILSVESREKGRLQDITMNLFDMPLTTANIDSDKAVTVLSSGTKWNGDAVGFSEGNYPWSPFPACQLAAVYPAGVIGIKDSGTASFTIAVNTVRAILDTEFYHPGKMGCSGHTPIPQVVARLGMKSEMLPVLRLFAQKYQRFPNGFMHYLDRDAENFKDGGYIPRLLSGAEDETAWNNVHEKSDGVRVCLPKDGFAHMYYEPSSNFMCGINEMLLQSHDGLIRVFPAVQDDYTAMFTLLAQGNFLVTSEMIGGEIMYIAVKSLSGGKCKVQSPWQCDFNVRNGTEGIQFQIEGDAAVFETECGGTYVMERVEYPLAMYYTCAIAAKKEPGVKKLGTAVLGIERQY